MDGVPRFFKIIASPSIDLRKLVIPPEFTNVFERLTHVYLRAPRGVDHKVCLTKEDDNLWFTTGWMDLAYRYSLSYGNMLVFQYIGNSRFHVSIFNVSGYELNYPNFDIANPDENAEQTPEKDRGFTTPSLGSGSGSGSRSRRGKEMMALALGKSEAYKVECENPHFTVSLSRSYLGEDSRLWVPTTHAREHLKKEDNVASLQFEELPETWSVQMKRTTGKGDGENIRFGSGWKNFAHDNGFKVGDVCVFELISPSPPSYRVRIARD